MKMIRKRMVKNACRVFIKNWSSRRILKNNRRIIMKGQSSHRKQAKFIRRILQSLMPNKHPVHACQKSASYCNLGGDLVLLCSDDLYGVLSITLIISPSPSPPPKKKKNCNKMLINDKQAFYIMLFQNNSINSIIS